MTRVSRQVLVMAGVLLFHATGALAQSSASWRVAFGRDDAALRDIARCCKPVDASPVTFRGTGTALFVEHQRLRGARLQRLEFSVARTGNFVYDSGLDKVARPEVTDSPASTPGTSTAGTCSPTLSFVGWILERAFRSADRAHV